MRALLDDRARLHHQNQVGVHDRGEPVRDHKARAVLHDGLHRANDGLLGAGVHARGGLVEDEDRRVGEHGARDCEELALALLMFSASFASSVS